jgi:hypothetical protein
MSYDAATEMVRQAFVAQYGYDPALVDNWLKFIIEEERERIIALLEEQECDCDSDDCDGWAVGDIEPLIALIKGENE